jgi:hypothetical protein
VIVTMLIAWWAISIVGHQLSSTVTLPKSTTSESSERQTPSPAPRPRPSTSSPGGTHRPGAGVVAGPPIGSSSQPGLPSGSPVVGSGSGHDGPPPTRKPSPRPRPTTPPPTSQPPSQVSDQRAIETDGGTAAFTCTRTDAMSLLYATSAPGYTTDPPRIRSESRIEVDFRGQPVDQKVDARCEAGKVTYTIEH